MEQLPRKNQGKDFVCVVVY